MTQENKPQLKNGPQQARGSRLALLSLVALGIIYGDIGTSPLYAMRECFHGDYGVQASRDNILGVLSLMFWTLLFIVTIKYLAFILRADNNGEGGVIALTALMTRAKKGNKKNGLILVGVGMFAASLLYGDGMITPAISVLSAAEGLRVITPVLEPYVIAVTVAILIGLFFFQRRGTGGVGILFGPVTLLWLLVIAVLGFRSIVQYPTVLAAVNPVHGIRFITQNHLAGFLVLGAVFLVATGTEALYADLGHFGRRPIRITWLDLVLPALLCNYFGQGAFLLQHPEETHHPFYALAPGWMQIPLVILATAATIIASQAVISGAFSLTHQAIQLGYLPRLRVVHTSKTEKGQIYIPQVNWILMCTTILLVLGFQSSSNLAAAYGMAVTTTMTVTTILFYVVARSQLKWSRLKAGIPVAIFLAVDLSFLSANVYKIAHGAWFPLAIGAVAFLLLTTWQKGRNILVQKLYGKNPSLTQFIRQIQSEPCTRVPGKAVFLAGRIDTMPPALLHNFKHNRVVHEKVAVLTVSIQEVPQVSREEKLEMDSLGDGFHRIVYRIGFMEEPNVPHALALAREKGLDFKLEDVSFFLGRERLMPDRHPLMPVWREKIFAFISRNAVGMTAYFHIPANQVIEIGSQIEI